MKIDQWKRLYVWRWGWLWWVTALPVLLVSGAASAPANTDEVPAPIVEAVHDALDAWSQLATTGDMAVLEDAFVAAGPQWRQFEAEVASGEASPGGERLDLEIGELRLRNVDHARASVWVEVEASRAGFVSEVFGWDFELIHQEGRWQVWTVVAADEPPVSLQTPATPGSTLVETTATTTAPDTSLAGSGAKSVEGGPIAANADAPPRSTRLPLVSAWVVVITVVGVAVAGYMAPRIDRSSEG